MRGYVSGFSVADLETLNGKLAEACELLPVIDNDINVSEDSPKYFDVNMLAEHLQQVATEQGGNLAGFISTLGLRIRGMLADQRLGAVIGRYPATTFDQWLKNYIGENGASNGDVAVIDLSLVPSEVVHIVVSVLARLVFESLQRYRRNHPEGQSLPTVLVLEEAHTFVRRRPRGRCGRQRLRLRCAGRPLSVLLGRVANLAWGWYCRPSDRLNAVPDDSRAMQYIPFAPYCERR